jgi:hypothetical protein
LSSISGDTNNMEVVHQPFVDGNAIQAAWEQREEYLIRRWRKKTPRYRPIGVADPPLLAAPVHPTVAPPVHIHPVQPPQVQPPVQAVAVPPVVSGSIAIPLPQAQGDDPRQRDSTPLAPDSPETLAGGSPPYVLVNNRAKLHPSRGQRVHVRNDMNDQGWKFVSVLYQTGMDAKESLSSGLRINRAEVALDPFKSVSLYVRPDEHGQIVDVSIAESIIEQNVLNLQQQLVVKCADISSANDSVYPKNEIEKNELLKRLRCSHLLRYRGNGVRTTYKTVIPSDPYRRDSQQILYMYTDFAEYGDLSSVIRAHAREMQ